MTTKIQVWLLPNGKARCVNASRETVAIRLPGADRSVSVRPNTRFEGDFHNRVDESLPPAEISEVERSPAIYPSVVRRATEEDLPVLLDAVPKILAETTLLSISESKVEALIERCVRHQGGALAGVIDDEDGIAASIGMIFSESDISDEPYIRAVWVGLHSNMRRESRKDDPRTHYARRLFEFARWCHVGLERAADRPIILQFDVATRMALGAKLGLFHRNINQTGASFAFGADGHFLNQGVVAEVA